MAVEVLNELLGVTKDTTFCPMAMQFALTITEPALIRQALLRDAKPEYQLEHTALGYEQTNEALAQAILQALNA